MKLYLKLIRPYGMLFIGFTPFFGAIANGEFRVVPLTLLIMIGMLAHIFTFVQNDYYDTEIDKKSKYVSNRPLVTKGISKKIAIATFLFSFIISLIFSIAFLFTFYSFFVLLLSFLCMTLYNKYSKRLFGMEYILSIGVFLYGIYGALTVSNSISNLAIIISAIGFMHWLFSVGISANLKDVEFDTKLGIRTTPAVFGEYAKGKKLFIPTSFRLYTYFIKISHVLIAALPFILGYTSIVVYNVPIPGICFLIISFSLLFLTQKILSTPISRRDNMLIYIGVQEGLALLLIPIALTDILIDSIALLSTFLLILLLIFWPLFWFRFLFGKKMIPLE